MTQPINPALTGGPNHDGQNSLAKESKVGIATTFILTVVATAVLGYLGQLDLSTLPGWMSGAATFAVTSLAGLLAAYVKKNR